MADWTRDDGGGRVIKGWRLALAMVAGLAALPSGAQGNPNRPSLEDFQKQVVEVLDKDWRSPNAQADEYDPSIVAVYLRGDHYFATRFDISELYLQSWYEPKERRESAIAAYAKKHWLDPRSAQYASNPFIRIVSVTTVGVWREQFGAEDSLQFPIFDRLTADIVISYENRGGSFYLWGPIRNGDLSGILRKDLVHKAYQNLETSAKNLVISPLRNDLFFVGAKRPELMDEVVLNDAASMVLSQEFARQASLKFPSGFYIAMPEQNRLFLADARLPNAKAKLRAEADQLRRDAEARFRRATTQPSCTEVNQKMQAMVEGVKRKLGSAVADSSSRSFEPISEAECNKLWQKSARFRPESFAYEPLSAHVYELRDGKLAVVE